MPSEPTTDRPTGTIFELDIFREKLERRANTVEGSATLTDSGEVDTGDRLARELRDIAAELKTLIDNCMEQYVHTASPESDGAAGETGDCDACGKTFTADDLTFRAYGEGGNHVADGSFCPDCNGTPLPNPPTERTGSDA